VVYRTRAGQRKAIPLGPCLIEQSGGRRVAIVWGASGQHSAELPVEEMKNAADKGHLVLLD